MSSSVRPANSVCYPAAFSAIEGATCGCEWDGSVRANCRLWRAAHVVAPAAGTIAIILDDETIHDVPLAQLRRRSDEFGHDRIKAFMMAPVEFE